MKKIVGNTVIALASLFFAVVAFNSTACASETEKYNESDISASYMEGNNAVIILDEDIKIVLSDFEGDINSIELDVNMSTQNTNSLLRKPAYGFSQTWYVTASVKNGKAKTTYVERSRSKSHIEGYVTAYYRGSIPRANQANGYTIYAGNINFWRATKN